MAVIGLNKRFTSRPLVEINPKSPPNVYAPQSVVIKGIKADGIPYKVDVGRMCYLDREECVSKGRFHMFGPVNTRSLSHQRVAWFKNYLDCSFRKGWRDETLRGKLHCVRYFFQFCDFDEGLKPTSLDTLLKEYERYRLMLGQRVRVSSSVSLSSESIGKRLDSVRCFIQWACELSDSEILSYIPKHRRKKSKAGKGARTVSLKEGQDYLRTCLLCFNQFSDAILDNKYPVHVKPLYSEDDDLYWHAPKGVTLKSLPNCFDVNGDPLPEEEIFDIIAKNFKHNNQGEKGFYQKALICNRNEWVSGKLNSKKVYSYNLSTFCFFQLYLGFTASNVQTALDLKISDFDLNKIGSETFARKHKFRAGRTVDFTAPSHLKREMEKYLKLRKWADELGLCGDSGDFLFAKIGGGYSLNRLERSSGFRLIKNSPMFKGMALVSSKEIRQLSGEFFIRRSRGKISLLAKKLNNTISTASHSYTAIDLESQAVEMGRFHEALSSKVRKFNRVTDDPIPVGIVRDSNVERVASGSCSNFNAESPSRVEGFNEMAPEPSCGTFESCLFCKYFAIHRDFEDVHKLLSLREALRITSSIRNDPEHHQAVVEPALYRVEEIVEFIVQHCDSGFDLVSRVEEQIEMGIYSVRWKRQIETLASQTNSLNGEN